MSGLNRTVTPNSSRITSPLPAWRWAMVAACLGLAAGLWEAGLLFFRPRLSTLSAAEAGWSIWALAPVIDACLFAVWGALLARLLGSFRSVRRFAGTIIFVLLVGAFGAHVAWSYRLTPEWIGNLTAIEDLTFPKYGFLGGLIAGYLLWRLGESRISRLTDGTARLSTRQFAAATAVLISAAGLGLSLRPTRAQITVGKPIGSSHRPNIVLITLDAARADHFSSYGYERPTTPNIDRLAARGVLFENAIASSSWTLPSHASILTGLLPHQHGADEGLPASPQVWILPEIMRKHGYQTAGFNANPLYGQKAWGLGDGFETYVDYSNSVKYNLALTLAGRLFAQPAYQSWVRYDLFCRQRAAGLTDSALRWHEGKSERPFFLFVHFFEPHDSYLPPPPYDRRFGQISHELARRVSFGHSLVPERPLTADEQRDVIAAYDNGLAYADEQIGRLLEAIEQSPERDNTYIILTSDHGEAFGEHGPYGHGWTLNREVLHVPLIMAGPDIPSGQRVSTVARTRGIFATVIEIALSKQFPFTRATLRRFWNRNFQPESFDEFAISELSSGYLALGIPPAISITTPEWHYIHDAKGRTQLYRWTSDPGEKSDLSPLAEYQNVLRELHEQVSAQVGGSVRPWYSPQYLMALEQPGTRFLQDVVFAPRHCAPSVKPGPRIGMSQDFFPKDTSSKQHPRHRSDDDLLRSLPYH